MIRGFSVYIIAGKEGQQTKTTGAYIRDSFSSMASLIKLFVVLPVACIWA
jgi:hypothetical protein